MKLTLITGLLLLFSFVSIGQSVSFSINSSNYQLDNTVKDVGISGEHRMDWVQMGFRIPSNERPGSFDVVSLVFYGTKPGSYKVGCCDANGETFQNVISAGWWKSAKDRQEITSGGGYAETTRGEIVIESANNDTVSGSFNCVINGNRIRGTFKNVNVPQLNAW